MATSVFLDRENQAFIDEANKPGNPPLEDLSVQQIRDEFEQLQKHSPIPGVDVTDFHVPIGTKKSDSIRTVLFRAEYLKKEDLPVIFWIHGGGWIAGNAFIYDSICRDLALQTSCAIVFPEYSLAPEKKFPTQIEECFEVMKFVAKKGKNFGLQTRAFALVGDSAGGQIAPALATVAHERHLQVPIEHQVLFSPVTDVRDNFTTRSELEFFENFFITTPSLPIGLERAFGTISARVSPFSRHQF